MKRVLSLPSMSLLVAGALLGFPACDLGLDDAVHRNPPAGRVIETGTGTPIPGARVILSDCDGEFLGNSNCVMLDSTQSDASGNYAFTRWGFMVNAQKEGYFTDDNTSALVLDGSEENTDIVLPPYAWLEVKLKNESGADFEIIPPGTGGSGTQGICLTQSMDTVMPALLIRGNQNYKYLFSIRSGGVSLQDTGGIYIYYEDGSLLGEPSLENSLSPWFSVYCPGHDTTKITIAY
ncbi:MAG: carboxypeptidase regulatory-like domain-containing protein [Saprospiraceae bacterium]|nr:carboxypeptidase regulatory-like domain-containing protein [Saprospiraceae bacterium]